MPAQIYLIRHGETEWSRTGQHTSTTDLPLTPNGEEEARRAAERIQGITFSRALVSPRQRARRTCEIVGLASVAEVEPNVREWDYGDFEGLRSAEILERRPDWNLFRDGAPRGESPDQVAARADAVIARLRTLEGKIAIVSHGHFLRAFAARWVNLPIGAGERLLLGTASLSVLGYEHNQVEKPVIILWNRRSE